MRLVSKHEAIFLMAATIFLLSSCTPALTPRPTTTPVAPPSPTRTTEPPTYAPTITSQPTEDASQSGEDALHNLAGLVKDYQLGQDAEDLISTLTQSVATFLNSAAQPLTQTTADTLRDRLQAMVPTFPGERVMVMVSDVDGDLTSDLLLALPWVYSGSAAFVFLGGQGYSSIPLPPNYAEQGEQASFLSSAWASSIGIEDVTGDDKPEAIITYKLMGASSLNVRVYIFGWIPETGEFDTIFQATLVNWAGESTWETRPGPSGSQEIILSGPAFGVFDHKLLPHPTRTQVWRWDAVSGRFTQAEERISEPTTRRQKVNVAEALLRQSAYEQAIVEYRKAIEDEVLMDESGFGTEADWRGFSQLRLGQVYALLGEEEAARTALRKAEGAGGTIARLSAAFLDAYHGGDTVVTAWSVMMEAVDIYQLLSTEEGGNIRFPMEAFSIYYPGVAMVAYLDLHAEATGSTPKELMAELTTLGFDVKSVLLGDLNSDGKQEVAFVTASPDQQHAWLAHEQDGRWHLKILTESQELFLQNITPLADGGAVLTVRFPEWHIPPLLGFSMDKDSIVRYDVAGEMPKALPRLWPTIGVN